MFGLKITRPRALDGGEETGYLADLSRARVTQGLILSRGRGNSRDQMLTMRIAHRLALPHSQSMFDLVTQTGGENVLRDETNNRKERLRRKVQFLLTIIKITVTIYHEIPVSDFI